jgi:thiaminase/transcriptional activator TenA
MLHIELWRANQDLVRACRDHRFVRGLEQGTLPQEVFERYVAQDAFYLEAFFRAYALAAARCEGRHAMAVTFYRLMGGVLEELELHGAEAQRLQIELAGVVPYPSTVAYTEFLLTTAWHRGLAETVAAMTPCMRLYAYLGQELAACRSDQHPYRDWIDTYASDVVEELAAELEAVLDSCAKDGPEVRDAYRHALQCEVDFFSAPFEDAVTPGPG